MTVSVVIPTYKAAGFIRRTLGSVFHQTCPPDEVVVVDDRSPDDTVGVVRQAAASAPVPVRVIVLPRNSGGPARPLNVGVQAARGDLVALLDHDDLMEPDKLSAQVAAAAGVGLVSHRCEVVGGSPAAWLPELMTGVAEWLARVPKEPVGPGAFRIGRRDAYSALVNFNYTLTCSTMLFPRAVWRSVGGFDPRFRMSCDYTFMQKVTTRWDVAYVDRPLVRWCRHQDTLTDRDGLLAAEIEFFRVLARFRRYRLLPDDARQLDRWLRHMRDQSLGTACQVRDGGQPARALPVLWTLLRHRPGLRLFLATAKAAVACVTGRRPGRPSRDEVGCG